LLKTKEVVSSDAKSTKSAAKKLQKVVDEKAKAAKTTNPPITANSPPRR